MKLMKMTMVGLLITALGLVSIAWAAQRQFLGGYRDWDAFVEKRDKGEIVCYMISVPKDTAPKNVNRGEIYAMLTNWPKAKIKNQVSIIVGYPFKKGSTATVRIDNRTYKMFTDGDRAWAWDSKQDAQMAAAMKRGARMTVKGVSSRGTHTTDNYSLLGFTAAHNAISKACN